MISVLMAITQDRRYKLRRTLRHIWMLLQRLDVRTTNNRPIGILASRFKSLMIGNSKANQPFVLQLHVVDAVEVGDLGIGDFTFCSCN